ncbi:MAG: hypothetical protein HUJ28_11365 [Chromatiales bacterium]|nr:hypothetical protein [Chromatiales bacterium]
MDKTTISVVTIGHMPSEFDKRKIKSWKSALFSVVGDIENYSLTQDSDGYGWEFTDAKLEQVLPEQFTGNFLIAIVNVPLEYNWYTRRLSKNRVVFTFHEIKDILNGFNIPLENAVFRLLYAYTFLYKRSGERIPLNDEATNFTHDETRGCLFDMNGIKTDIIYSLHEPIICPDCVERLRKEKVSNETISKAQNEIIKIKKPLFYRIVSFVKKHPIWSMVISAISAIILGAIGSYIATVIYEATKNTV